MENEFQKMQRIAGVPVTENKESLNENFVGLGMVGNIFDRPKTDYELAFDHFTKDTVNENEVEEDEEIEESSVSENSGNPRIDILRKMGSINDIVISMLEDDIKNTYGTEEGNGIYIEYMKFVNTVKDLIG